MKSLVINVLSFQLGWFACVLGAAHGLPWLGAGIGLTLVLGHLGQADHRTGELKLLLTVGIAGTVWDSLLVALGYMEYPSGQLAPWLAPYWITVMWLLFAMTLNISLRWLRDRYLLASLLGAVAGPLAYHAGALLGGVSFPDVTRALIALSAGWAFIMPALIAISARFSVEPREAPSASNSVSL